MIITGVAEHSRPRIAHLVYIDAFVPDHGQSALQLLPESIRDAFRKQADADGGWRSGRAIANSICGGSKTVQRATL